MVVDFASGSLAMRLNRLARTAAFVLLVTVYAVIFQTDALNRGALRTLSGDGFAETSRSRGHQHRDQHEESPTPQLNTSHLNGKWMTLPPTGSGWVNRRNVSGQENQGGSVVVRWPASSRVEFQVFSGTAPPLLHALHPMSCLAQNADADQHGTTRNRTALDHPYTTQITTDLRILFTGDSVAHQLAVQYQLAAGSLSNKMLEFIKMGYLQSDGLTVSSPTRGGGRVAYWRINGILTKQSMGAKLPNKGPGWMESFADHLVNYTTSLKPKQHSTDVGRPVYDVVIQRIAHPWTVRYSETKVTQEHLRESVETVAERFGARVVIFVTAHWNDAIVTKEDYNDWARANRAVLHFARQYNNATTLLRKPSSSVQHVLVADMAAYADRLIAVNAKRLGYDGSTLTLLQERLLVRKPGIALSIPALCSERVKNGAQTGCQRNALFFDRSHLCMSTVGPRMDAVLSCLTACAFPTVPSQAEAEQDHQQKNNDEETARSAQVCQDRCNKKYMSIDRLDDAVAPPSSVAGLGTIYQDILPVLPTEPKRSIRYTLHRNEKPRIVPEIPLPYGCNPNHGKYRGRRSPFNTTSLPPGVLDFTVRIDTDLHILFIGDSIMHQIAANFEVVAGAVRHQTIVDLPWKAGLGVGATVAVNTTGGGAVAYWRLTGLFLRRFEGELLPNLGLGWRRSHMDALKEYTATALTKNSVVRRTVDGSPAYDVVAHRLDHPWLPAEEVTTKSLQGLVDMAQLSFNPRVLILVTSHFNNNVGEQQQWRELQNANEVARNFSASFRPAPVVSLGTDTDDGRSIRHVLVLDVARYVDAVIDFNAASIGYDVPNDTSNARLFDKLLQEKTKKYAMSVGMVCSEKADERGQDCLRNSFINDGMHLCMENLGPRIEAALGCIMKCVYDHNNENDSDKNNERNDQESVKRCEQTCNTRYMSLRPIDPVDITTG